MSQTIASTDVTDSSPARAERTAVSARVRAYRPDIDGLRSLAILPVVFFHAGIPWLSGGFTGVDIFFVISGYLIGGHIDGDLRSGTFSFLNFYRLRAKRILPALYVVLAALLLLGFVLLSPLEYRALAKSAFASVASVSNFLFWRTSNYFAPASDRYPLLMTWSLGVEEQFYLVIPVLMVILARLRRVWALPVMGLVVAVSLAIAWYEVVHNPTVAFYLPHCRAWELAAGVMLAIAQAERRQAPSQGSAALPSVLGWAGLALLLAPMFLLTAKTPFPGPAAVPSVAGAVLLLASPRSWVNRKLLQLPLLVFIGRVSYSFYLWHWPILAMLRILRGGSFPVAWGLIAIGFAFGLALLSYYLVELPFRSSKLSAAPLLLRYGLASLVLLALCSVLVFTNGLVRRYPALASLERAQQVTQGFQCLAVDGESLPRLLPGCVAPASSLDRFALWGDSHAAALAPALDTVVAREGYAFEVYAKTVCPPLAGVGRYYRRDPAHLRECIAFNQAVLARLVADPSVKVVALQAYWEAPFDPQSDDGKLFETAERGVNLPTEAESRGILERSLRKTIQDLQSAGKRVVVFGDVPTFQVDPLWRMRTVDIPLRRLLAQAMSPNHAAIDPGSDIVDDDSLPQSEGRALVRQTTEAIPGATFWDLRQQLCGTSSSCRYRQGGTPFFIDPSHFSVEGGRAALEQWSAPSLVTPASKPPQPD